MSYLEIDETVIKRNLALEVLVCLEQKTDIDSQIAYMEAGTSYRISPITEAILKSLKKLKSMIQIESDDIVLEKDTFDPEAGMCTGKCHMMGVVLTQCSECGWDDTYR
jgi:hypothetical protein